MTTTAAPTWTATGRPLLLASAAVIGFLGAWLTPLTGAMSFALGTIPASTGPLAVTALGRRLAPPDASRCRYRTRAC
jgi:NhaP-type Na+/H+ or K+/H+ antiporter